MRVVLDASVALAAVLPDEDSTFARSALAMAANDGLVVPALWAYEIQNGLVTAIRRDRIDEPSAMEALRAIGLLGAEVDCPREYGREAEIALRHGLTAYDAAYLVVALKTGAHLATTDATMQRAAKAAGVSLFVPPI